MQASEIVRRPHALQTKHRGDRALDDCALALDRGERGLALLAAQAWRTRGDGWRRRCARLAKLHPPDRAGSGIDVPGAGVADQNGRACRQAGWLARIEDALRAGNQPLAGGRPARILHAQQCRDQRCHRVGGNAGAVVSSRAKKMSECHSWLTSDLFRDHAGWRCGLDTRGAFTHQRQRHETGVWVHARFQVHQKTLLFRRRRSLEVFEERRLLGPAQRREAVERRKGGGGKMRTIYQATGTAVLEHHSPAHGDRGDLRRAADAFILDPSDNGLSIERNLHGADQQQAAAPRQSASLKNTA